MGLSTIRPIRLPPKRGKFFSRKIFSLEASSESEGPQRKNLSFGKKTLNAPQIGFRLGREVVIMKTTFPTNRCICIIVEIKSLFSEKKRFEKIVCADVTTVKLWLKKKFGKCEENIKKGKQFKFFTFIDGRFAKLPNDEVYAIIHNKLA